MLAVLGFHGPTSDYSLLERDRLDTTVLWWPQWFMAKRKVPLLKGRFYHVFSRGVEKRNIFLRNKDYLHFIDAAKHYLYYPHQRFSLTQKQLRSRSATAAQLRQEKVKIPNVDIINLCLMLNHFHLTLRQNAENGITNFMQQLLNSYSHYFNIKYDRAGGLFQSKFKAVLIESEAQLIHLSRYIHINPIRSSYTRVKVGSLEEYPWSSLEFYLGRAETFNFCKKDPVMEHFRGPNDYRKFVLSEISGSEIGLIKDFTIDDDFGWSL